jgi:glycosyltransferase involved in cell wall biosynthesis
VEARWLLDHGHHCVIACPLFSEIMWHARDLRIPVVPASMRNSADLRGMRALGLAIQDHRIQLINTHGSKDTWLSLPYFLSGIPVVRTRHITDPVRCGFRHSLGYRHACSRLVASAACIKSALVSNNGIPRSHIRVIGEFVDLEHFSPRAPDENFRSRHGVPATSPLFALIGMIRSEKGQTTFVEAALRLQQSHPQARFAIVGEGVGDRTMERKCVQRLREAFGSSADLSRTPIFMTGFFPDVREAMASADVIVVPSHAEAQSRVVPEAFAMGKCVLASNVGGLPEIIEHGRTGWLVPPRDSIALAAAMRLLADDNSLRSELSSQVRAHAEAYFSIDARMEETVALYREIICGTTGIRMARTGRRMRRCQPDLKTRRTRPGSEQRH